MQFKTITSPHKLNSNTVTRVMFKVLLALLPGTVVMAYFFGWGVLTNLVCAIATAMLVEACIMILRKQPIKPAITDLSVVVTAWLLALSMPSSAPLWLIAVASFFATAFAKHVYGGLGYNPFNPAMVGYVVALISFPVQMTQWPPAHLDLSLVQTLHTVWTGEWVTSPKLPSLDMLTGATVLDYSRTELSQGLPISFIFQDERFGILGSAHWEWVAIAYLFGGLWLIALRVMPWHAPVGVITAFIVMATIFNLINHNHFPNAVFHLFSGGAILGAFFIVTDPVSGSTSNRGRFIFGLIVGVIAYTIRTWGGYPDGIAFGVLLANMCAPVLDYYSKPKVFGK